MPIVYLAEHPALALLEHLVNLQLAPDELPDTYQLLMVHAPDTLESATIGLDSLEKRNADWRTDLELTRSLGDAWLRAGGTALCAVPSVILPASTNYLLNPSHQDSATVGIVTITRPPYDRRLFRPL